MKQITPRYPGVRANLTHGAALILAAIAWSILMGCVALFCWTVCDALLGTDFLAIASWRFIIKGAIVLGSGGVLLGYLPAPKAASAKQDVTISD